MLDMDTLAALADPKVRQVFKRVLKARSARFEQLARQLAALVSPEELQAALDTLQTAGFIDQFRSQLPEFSTYFITADGLTVARQVRL